MILLYVVVGVACVSATCIIVFAGVVAVAPSSSFGMYVRSYVTGSKTSADMTALHVLAGQATPRADI